MNVLILCAGRGTRLQATIGDQPKTTIRFGKSSLLQRLLKELIPSNTVSNIYINVSTGARATLNELDPSTCFPKVQILYEHEPWGPSLTTYEILKSSSQGLLVIHGDLLLESGQLNNFILELTQITAENALLVVHRREISSASQIVKTDESGLVEAILWKASTPASFNTDQSIKDKSVFVDSGIYYFPFSTHTALKTPTLNTGISEDLLPALIEEKLLGIIPWRGLRFAIDTVEKFEIAKTAFKSFPDKF